MKKKVIALSLLITAMSLTTATAATNDNCNSNVLNNTNTNCNILTKGVNSFCLNKQSLLNNISIDCTDFAYKYLSNSACADKYKDFINYLKNCGNNKSDFTEYCNSKILAKNENNTANKILNTSCPISNNTDNKNKINFKDSILNNTTINSSNTQNCSITNNIINSNTTSNAFNIAYNKLNYLLSCSKPDNSKPNNCNSSNANNNNSNNANNNNSNNANNNNSNNANNNNSNNANNNSSNANNNNNNTNNNNNSVGNTNNSSATNLSYEEQVVELVNIERAKNGLSPLTLDSTVSNSARTKSQDMINNNYFSHTSPTYGSVGDMLKHFNIKYSTYGENIAYGQKTPEQVVNAWMNSSGHRANILNASFTKIGVGYAVSSNGTAYWTQQFIG